MFEAPGYGQSAAVVRRPDVTPGVGSFGDFDLGRFWSVLWNGKGTILLSIVVALLLAAAFVEFAPRKYTATTQILVDPMDLRAAQTDISQTIPQSDAAVLQVESQARVIASDNILRRVVASEGLDHDPEFEAGAKSPDQAPLTALDNLRKHVDIKRPERTYVIEVSVTSEDPAKAARIANAIAQTFLAEQTEIRADAARQVSQALSSRLKELQDKLRASEDKVEAYKKANNIVGANGELVNEQQLSNLTTELSTARARTAQAKARLEQIENVQRSKIEIGAFPEAVQSATITALRTQYTDVMRREAEQKSSLGDRHPAVIEIEAQAERVHKLIEDEVNRIALSARTEYESAKTSEDLLGQKVAALQSTTESTNQSLVGLRELERDAQANRTVYESFLVRARETSEQEQIDTKNIRIISRADLPLTRSSPPPSILIGLAAMMLGAACGTGIVLMRAMGEADKPRKLPVEKPQRRFGETMRNLWPVSMPLRLRSRHETEPEIRVLAELPPADISYGLDAIENPHSRFAREIQKVYDAIRESHGKRANPSVLVAATDDQDDTASVSLALAAAIAETQRVLLIDADLERRTLAALDADDSDAGLVDVATGRRELSEVIVRDDDTNINMLPFVAPDSRRDRPISDADVRQAFNKTKRFDMVIVAAVDLNREPSTLFFAGIVDHIILVVRPDEEDRRAAEQFMSRLGPDAMKVRGAVLTGVA
jgi:polysaccharide biosynthesis transport protein